MRYKNYNQFLNEGSYDKLAGEIVDAIWPIIKLTSPKGEHEMLQFDLGEFNDKVFIDDAQLFIKREAVSNSRGVIVDAGAYPSVNGIEFIVTLDPAKEPQSYQKLNAVLQDAARHEIEHLTQGGENRRPSKVKITGSIIRNKISGDKGNLYKYFLLKDEVPAMANGMYRQAKTEKRPLNDVFNEYLDYFIDQKLMTKTERNKVLKTWITFAKKNLPKAQYTI